MKSHTINKALNNTKSLVDSSTPESFFTTRYNRNFLREVKSVDPAREKEIETHNNMLLNKILALKKPRPKPKPTMIPSLNYAQRVKEQTRIAHENIRFLKTLK